jgi:phytol kinase
MIVACFIALVLGALSVLLFGVNTLQRRGRIGPEGGRKLVHLGMGLVGLSLPWFFRDARPVWLLALVGGVVVAVVRFVPAATQRLGGVLGGVSRSSLGDLYFPLGVALGFTLAHGDPVLYCGALGVLVFADTAGALVGVQWGRLRYSLFGNRKSIEGSAAVWLVSAVWLALVEITLGRSEWPVALLGGVLAAAAATVIEAVSGRGLDNLLLPVGVVGFMALWNDRADDKTTLRLAGVTVTVVAFTVFVVAAGISARKQLRPVSLHVAPP